MADDAVIVVPEKDLVKQQSPGMWGSLCLIVAAIAHTMATADVVEMTNFFRNLFRMFLALIILIGSGWVVYRISMVKEADLNQYAGVIIGFVTSSALMAVIGFYFGGQDRSKLPDEDAAGKVDQTQSKTDAAFLAMIDRVKEEEERKRVEAEKTKAMEK
jgi:uncharacterized transporter YbjL